MCFSLPFSIIVSQRIERLFSNRSSSLNFGNIQFCVVVVVNYICLSSLDIHRNIVNSNELIRTSRNSSSEWFHPSNIIVLCAWLLTTHTQFPFQITCVCVCVSIYCVWKIYSLLVELMLNHFIVKFHIVWLFFMPKGLKVCENQPKIVISFEAYCMKKFQISHLYSWEKKERGKRSFWASFSTRANFSLDQKSLIRRKMMIKSFKFSSFSW